LSAHDLRGLTPLQAEEYLLSLELFGMRFGLDRMHRLMTVLGLPQRRFASIHVVGSNGKSSTVRFCAAILERHGLRTGSYTSPHLRSFRERIEVGEEPVSEADFAAAVTRAAQAAELVNRTAEPEDHVTQFEALTAAAYHELARRGVEVAVIEAGLGGRFDATNVIPSKVQVLTSVSLEHTRWLGPTLTDIAGEKLAVVHDYGTLVVGDLPAEALAVAKEVAAERHVKLVEPGGQSAAEGGHPRAAPPDAHGPHPAAEGRHGREAPPDAHGAHSAAELPLRAAGRFQHTNFALAAAAAEAFLGRPLEDAALTAAAAQTVVPGRLEPVGERPLTLFDGAHNPSGAHALAASLPEVFGERRPRVAVIGVLEDKDAAGMLGTLLPQLDHVVFTRPANPRALSPATLVTLAEKLGGPPFETVPGPQAALARARELAGEGGAVLATGSIYLIADLVREDASTRASTL
jgi:dihydrofolate synthase / folylpolyglutamate synthase